VSAQLFYINPAVNPQTGAVDVKLDVPEPPPQWMQDMTVSVDIAVDRRDQAVVIPVLSLHDKDSAQPWVLQVVSGRAERRPVRLGLKSAGWIEVTQGLAPGDVLIPSSATVRPGDRVRLASR